jgi:hypothetical protein
MQRRGLLNLLKGVRILTAEEAGLIAQHPVIWIVAATVFGILATGLQSSEELNFKLLFK